MKKKIKCLCMLLLITIILAACYSGYIEPEMLVVKEITVETDMDIEKCRVVFFTDTHFGTLYDEKHIKRIVEILDMEYLQGELSTIEAKVGKYAVFGNHDYGGGAVRIYENFMNNCGFQVLDDETVFLEKFDIEIIGFQNI